MEVTYRIQKHPFIAFDTKMLQILQNSNTEITKRKNPANALNCPLEDLHSTPPLLISPVESLSVGNKCKSNDELFFIKVHAEGVAGNNCFFSLMNMLMKGDNESDGHK